MLKTLAPLLWPVGVIAVIVVSRSPNPYVVVIGVGMALRLAYWLGRKTGGDAR